MSQNTYCIFDNCLIYKGLHGRSAMHSHHFLQYGFSVSKSIELNSPDWSGPRNVSSFIAPSDSPHQIKLMGDNPALMIWLDPEFQIHQQVDLSDGIRCSLPDLETDIKSLLDSRLNCKTARQIKNRVTGWTSYRTLDERISSAIDWINSHLTQQTITTENVADWVHLSPSRFMHLFSEQIGIPVRKYILWQRLRRVLLLLAGDSHNLTEAAHEAGFTDSSHMNRTFNTMFGITPSKIFKNSRFIQVIAC